jgi:hypothetical protein
VLLEDHFGEGALPVDGYGAQEQRAETCLEVNVEVRVDEGAEEGEEGGEELVDLD